MSNNTASDLRIDLSSLQGQIANLILSLKSLDKQRSFEDLLFNSTELKNPLNQIPDDLKKGYIHHLKDIIAIFVTQNLSQESNEDDDIYQISYENGCIARFLYIAFLTLNVYLNEPTYNSDYELENVYETLDIGALTYNQELFSIVKNGFYKLTYNSTNLINCEFFDDKILNLKNKTDLLDLKKLLDSNGSKIRSIINGGENYEVIVPKKLIPNNNDFIDSCEKLLINLYKNYYCYEITDIQKRITNAYETDATKLLMSNLKIMLQKVNNIFSTFIYDQSNEKKYKSFPLSDIIEELNEYLIIDNNNETYLNNNINLFDNDETYGRQINLYEFIDEKTHMMNKIGQSIHYSLDIIKRLKKILNNSDEFSESYLTSNKISISDFCIKNMDEAIVMFDTIINDLKLTTGTSRPELTNNDLLIFDIKVTISEYKKKLIKTYDEFYNLIENSEIIAPTKLTTNDLKKIGLLDVLEYFIDIDTSNPTQNESTQCTHIKTYALFKNKKASRYNGRSLYRNYALTVIKINICFIILFMIKLLEWKHSILNKRNVVFRKTNIINKIEHTLNYNKPDVEYSLAEIALIRNIKKNLNQTLIKIRSDDEQNVFKLPSLTEWENDQITNKHTDEIFDVIANCMYNMAINKKVSEDLEIISSFNEIFDETLKKRLRPFVKTIIYYYDEYFNTTNSLSLIKNNSNDSKIEFEILINYLNYISQAITTNYSKNKDAYTNENFEKFLIKLIYLCNAITVNWSYNDKINSTNSVILDQESSIYNLFNQGELEISNYLFNIKTEKLIVTIDEENEETFKIVTIQFIWEEMVKILKATNLTNVTKFVAWLVLYVINCCIAHIYIIDMKFILN